MSRRIRMRRKIRKSYAHCILPDRDKGEVEIE